MPELPHWPEIWDLVLEDEPTIVATLRAMDDGRLQSTINAVSDKRNRDVWRDRWHTVLMLACDERDERRRMNERMLDAAFPTVALGEVMDDGPAVDSAGDQGGLPE
jgi:hypothetical protein